MFYGALLINEWFEYIVDAEHELVCMNVIENEIFNLVTSSCIERIRRYSREEIGREISRGEAEAE